MNSPGCLFETEYASWRHYFRVKTISWYGLVLWSVMLGCNGAESSNSTQGSGGRIDGGGAPSTGGLQAGGAQGGGGTPSTGGLQAGGAQGGGGAPSTGGLQATGGIAQSSGGATGGALVSGGQANSGGSSPVATGGVLATGGSKAVGGSIASGGTTHSTGGNTVVSSIPTGGTTTGGRTSTGGVTGGLTGGSMATGGQPNTGGAITIGTIKNPVLKGYWADPQVAMFNSKFYIYPTTDGIANWGATVFHAFSSTDLATWKDEGIILDLANVSWGKTNAWAPGITVKNGTYYYYFCDAKQIGVATSTSPVGPFKDVLGKPLVTAGQYGGQSIDPYVFDDDNGRSYLFFGNGNANGAELNADMVSFKTTPTTIALNGFREGSVVFKRNGKYYFMYSVSGTDSPDYHVAYAMSNAPLGPYTGGTTVLQSNTSLGIQSTGHNSVLALPNGDYYIVYHRWAIPGGDGTHRETCIDKMNFNTDGTIAPVVPTL